MATRQKIHITHRVRFMLIVPFMLMCVSVSSQVCTDPANVVYGLTNAGFIYPVNVNNGAVGSEINTPYTGNTPDLSNGLAYNPVNGKFYYFKRIPSSGITEFVSFDPSTNTYEMLASPATTNSVYSGSITNDGTGYYCWDTQGTLFYYNITNNTWTTITTSLVDQYGKDVDSIIRTHASGDGTIDGYGNLWILPSGETRYGLYRLSGPLPTTPTASITVLEIVPMTVQPAKFVGIAFTITGEIFMCTSDSRIYRLEDDHSLTLMSTMSFNMADLTSCNFPISVLAPDAISFTASLKDGNVHLNWTPYPGEGTFTYVVERSADNRNWSNVSTFSSLRFGVNRISFTDGAPLSGKNFYRVKIIVAGSTVKYSGVRQIDLQKANALMLWPNPARTDLYIHNGNTPSSLTIYDQAGNRIKAQRLSAGVNSISVAAFPAGRYFVTIRNNDGTTSSHKIIKK